MNIIPTYNKRRALTKDMQTYSTHDLLHNCVRAGLIRYMLNSKHATVNLLSKIIFLTLALCLAGCTESTTSANADNINTRSSTSNSNTKIVYIDHYKSECVGAGNPYMCLRTRENQNDQWGYHYDGIIDFNYEWGYTYKIEVSVKNIYSPSIQDRSSLEYTLLNIIEKRKEPTSSLVDISLGKFKYWDSNNFLVKLTSDIYKIYNYDKEIACRKSDCITIDSLLAQDMAILFEFFHQEDPSKPLIVSQIKCSSSRESFYSSCL